MRSHVLAVLIVLCGVHDGSAAEPPTAAQVEKDPASGVVLRGLMWRLSHTMQGRPVIATGYGAFRADVAWSDEAFRRARTDIEKLQILSAKNSPEDDPLIPYKVGDAYAIAPAMREAMKPDLGKPTMLDIAPRRVLLTDVLSRLTPDQAHALGAQEGVSVAALAPELRAEVARAFRPPLDIDAYAHQVDFDKDGLPRVSWRSNELGRIEKPLDWMQTRIRARLRMGGASVNVGDQGGDLYPDMGSGPHLEAHDGFDPDAPEVNAFMRVPNTYKPSDIVGKEFAQPIGISGVWSVKQVVDRLARVTGLKLSAWEPYRERPVFLGSASLRAGDVLDSLRLGLCGAWRKMGDAYYLAWDRVPLGAVQQTVREAVSGATDALTSYTSRMDTTPGYVLTLENLPFSEDDPLALTDEQRARLFGPSRPGEKAPSPSEFALPYDALTPGQQAYLRGLAPDSTIGAPMPGTEAPNGRVMTEEDARHATLSPFAHVEVSVSVPGYGWAPLQLYGQGLQFSRYALEAARRKADPDAGGDVRRFPPEVGALVNDPKPVTPPSDLRGLVVPALTPARLATLADEMKRHGLNVLFYPALFNGYATIPNAAFPGDPALKGEDGLAAAVAAMKPKGIRVVAYLNTLAWQNADTPVHWLNKHPDWLDVDVLGRGRLAFLKAHPQTRADLFLGRVADLHNYVRATAPAVEDRLKTLVRALASRKGLAAVAFAAWHPSGAIPYRGMGLQAPPLGFAAADRLAAFRASGADPADDATGRDYLPESVVNIIHVAPSDDETDLAHVSLVGRLMESARTFRKDWRVYLVDENAPVDGGSGGVPFVAAARPDLTIGYFGSGDDASLGTHGVLLPITARTVAEAMAGDDTPAVRQTVKAMGSLSPVVAFQLAFAEGGPAAGKALPMALYDFRDTPRIITDSLKWIAPPSG